MKKRILGVALGLVLMATALPLVAVSAQSTNPLDHVVITPNTATVVIGHDQQFTVRGEDSDNLTVDTVSFTWAVVAGGGSITNTGLFTANITGNFTDTIKVTATKDGIEKIGYASITVTPAPSEEGQGFVPPGFSKGNKKGWNGGYTPPGWSQGNKNGWNGGDTPPGLSKKTDLDDGNTPIGWLKNKIAGLFKNKNKK